VKTADLDVDAVVDRMREAAELPSDGRLAAYLGITRSAVSNWRRSGKLPIERVVEVHKRAGARLDWLLYGLGERAEVPYDGEERQLEFEAYDDDLLAIALKQIAFAERRLTRTRREIWELSTNINLAYIQNMNAYKAMTAGGSLKRDQALQALDAAIEHSQRSRQSAPPRAIKE
jgi:hypothetical protein